ncbi:MAG: EAL domain-containing protein [Janthinobacterium lividum]
MGTGLTLEEAINLYEHAPCGYVSVTMDGTILRANRTLAEWLGMHGSGVLEGRAFQDLFTAPSKLLYGTYYSSLLQMQGSVGDLALELSRVGMPPLPVIITSRIIDDGENRPAYISSTLFDITERRRYERELLVAKRTADILADVVRFSDTAILTASFDLDIETWNAAAQRLFGELLARPGSLSDLLPDSCVEQFVRSLETDSPAIFEYKVTSKALCKVTAYPLSDGIAIFFADITQDRASQAALQQAHERFALTTMATSDGIWDLDCETGVLYTSGRVQTMLGMEEREATQAFDEWLKRIHPVDAKKVRMKHAAFREIPGQRFESEYRVRHQDTSWRWLHSRGMPLLGPEGTLIRVIGSLTDITSRKQQDSLTGLDTRLSLIEKLDERISEAKPNHDGCALLFVDIDSFKKVNDGFSHIVGDQVLVEVARRLKTFLANDKRNIAARARADEFALLLNGVHDPEQAWLLAQQLHDALQLPFLTAGQQIRISASIGIALVKTAAGTADHMLRNADLAMHRAKAEGSGQTALFSDAMRLELSDRLSIEADLYRALEAGDLALFYQPKIDLVTEDVIGFEALGRWKHPTRGMVPPDVFIGIAEESQLICEIGRWTIRVAVRQLAEWRMRGLVSSSTTMSVNLSPKQFGDPDLIEFLRIELARNNLPAACLTMEITEGVLIGNSAEARRVLAELKEVGVGLDLDDFGKGYSSLSYLDRYPFDTLKLDRIFISRLGSEDDSSTITRSIIALGHALELKVIAEGIETRDQLKSLLAMGCHYGQGYLFAKPSAASDVERTVLLHGTSPSQRDVTSQEIGGFPESGKKQPLVMA